MNKAHGNQDNLRTRLDNSILQVIQQNTGTYFDDEDGPVRDLNEAIKDLCKIGSESPDRLDMLCIAIQWYIENEGCCIETEIADADSPFQSVLLALAGHILDERQRLKSA